MNDPKARLILIGGGTCSGKTTIAKAIAKRIHKLKYVIVSHDNYYKDLSHLSHEDACKVNFDHPDSIDLSYLLEDLHKMMAGEAVNVPEYSFITHSRNEGTLCVANADVLILEGIFALYYPELIQLSDLKIFVDTDADIRLSIRIQRDTLERGFDVESVLVQYTETVRPSHQAFIDPSKKNADVIIPGDRDFEKALYMLNAYLQYDLTKQ